MMGNTQIYFVFLLLPVAISGHARSTGGFEPLLVPRYSSPELSLSRRQQQAPIPLPQSTSSVKCKCQTQEKQQEGETLNVVSPESTQIESRSDHDIPDMGREIEIQIFKSEDDLKKSEQSSNVMQQDAHVNLHDSSQQPHSTYNNFHTFRTSQFFQPSEQLPQYLLLGKSTGPFEGPRRRKKRETRTKIIYVYPEKITLDEKSTTTTTTESSFPIFSYPFQALNIHLNKPSEKGENTLAERDTKIENDDIGATTLKINSAVIPPTDVPSLTLKDAMTQAWEDYGSDNVPTPVIVDPTELPISQPQQRPTKLKNNLFRLPINGLQRFQVPTYSYEFQRRGDLFQSPWDDKITQTPVPVLDREVPQPGPFSGILTRYIDFEVNNHEQADFLRKLLFGIIVGGLIAAWISLGVFFGIFPLHFLFGSGDSKERGLLKGGFKRGTEDLDNLTDNVLLALDSEWLKKLEDRVGMDRKGSFEKTVAKCCVLPQKNQVECKLTRKDKHGALVDGNKVKCASNLIYNFQFGGDEENET